MAMSGITVSDEILTKFKEMKDKHLHKYIFMKISDDEKTVEIDKTMAADTTLTKQKDVDFFKKMTAETLEDKEPRFIVYDMQNETDDGRIIEKIIFVTWCSDAAPIKKKMVYAATKDSVKQKLNGVAKSFQASDKGDMDYDEFLKQVLSK